MQEKLLCSHCGKPVEVETEFPQYPYVFRDCDENFYSFECIRPSSENQKG